MAPPSIAGSATPPHPWLNKMRALGALAFLVARADGRIEPVEQRRIRAFLAERFGHDEVLARHIDPLMESCATKQFDEAKILGVIAAGTDRVEREGLLAFAEEVAEAGGALDTSEHQLLERIAVAFGIPRLPRTRTAPVASAANDLPGPDRSVATPLQRSPRSLLEIDEEVALTAELVRRGFFAVTDKLDPSKAAQLGPEFAEMAEEKRALVRQAAEVLLKGLGAELEIPESPVQVDLRHNPDLDSVFGV